ncbi:hypothetical protein J3R74_001743 [Puniceicoccus vermicola]
MSTGLSLSRFNRSGTVGEVTPERQDPFAEATRYGEVGQQLQLRLRVCPSAVYSDEPWIES